LTNSSITNQSDYLVKRLINSPNENIFNYVKFRAIKDSLPNSELYILDLGCGTKIAKQYLNKLDLKFKYLGVDYETALDPDIIADLRSPEQISKLLPWTPNVITLLDVLEHLDGKELDILETLNCCNNILDENGLLIITVPQMYRLDKFKLKHLKYKEHKVRLKQKEWLKLIEKYFYVEEIKPIGYISVLPYLTMLYTGFNNDKLSGKIFRHLREITLEKEWIRKLDWLLSKNAPSFLRGWSNDVLFVCKPKK